jgi:nucleoside-diphosphate-sugar epimerase
MTKAFVTGGAGFVGSHLVDLLLDRGYPVTCLARKTDDLRWLEGTGARIVYGDCTDRESLERALEPDTAYVFHLAAVLHAERPELYEAVNVQGTRNLVEACRRKTPTLRRLVYTSSAVAAGPSGRHSACREEDPCSPVN